VLHIRLFKCYSHKDKRQRIALGAHLWQIQRVGVIAACDDRKMRAGQELAGKSAPTIEGKGCIAMNINVVFDVAPPDR